MQKRTINIVTFFASSLRGTKQSALLTKNLLITVKQIASSFLLAMTFAFCFSTTSAQQTQIKYLSGTGSDHTVKWDFFLTEGRNSGKWTTIPVPSNWELQGFGKYNYGFDKDSAKGKEKGLYKYRFTIPAGWQGKVINIVFEGSMTDTDVKINGKSAGPQHQGAFYAFKYDISDLLNYNKDNLLEVTVAKHSANASVNAAERKGDFWIFGGIFRPVYIEALPAQNISGVALDAKANGVFKGNLYLDNIKGASQIAAQIFASDGKKAGATFTTKINKGDRVASIQTVFNVPRLWSSEFPNLYRVDITLLQNGKPVHTISKRFGFRTVEVKERDGIYVNGVKMKFKGVCRHSFNPNTGRALNKTISIEDVTLMKDINMNAVRMSHYPPDEHFLDVCDSLGLYVMDELAGWHGMYDTPTGSKLVKEMIEHDVNHPSIVIWSNGNEGGHNLDLDTLFSQDIQKRSVVHPWQTFNGITTEHYREYNYGIGNYLNGHDIVMPTEFLHGWYDGGHGAGLEDYWEAMWTNPLAAGGFLWDFADEGVVRTDLNGKIDTDKDHGADGIVGPYHEKEGSYFTIKEIWSPIHFEHKEITDGFNGRFNIENRYQFTNLNQCSFTWNLKSLQHAVPSEAEGSIVTPDIKPLQKGTLQLQLPKNWLSYDVLYVTAFGPDKKEIFTWSFPIAYPANVVEAMFPVQNENKPQLQEQDSLYIVTANGITISINKGNGMLMQVQNRKGKIPFNNGPVLQQGINNFQNFTTHFEDNNLVISSTFDRKKSYNTLQWIIYPSGIIKMQVNYFPAEYFTSMDGVNFSFPESEMKGVEYMGYGPYRVWKNRMKGNKFGIWNKAYNNTETGEAAWIYPEFKGYYSNMYWCKFKTTGQPFTVFTSNEDLFLRLFTPAWKTDQWHNYEPIFPGGDISFMQGIPSIGSKTQRSETTGPMGMKNIFYDYEKDPSRCLSVTLFFDFSGN